MRTARRSGIAAALAGWLVVVPAAAQSLPPEKALERAEMQYLATEFDEAVATLEAALARCTPATCDKPMRARLHIALGHVLAAGKRQLEDAKDAFLEALDLDPNAAPNRELITSEVEYAYDKARREMGMPPLGDAPAPEPQAPTDAPKPKPEPEQEDHDAEGAIDVDPEVFDDDPNFNWITLSFGPDVSILGSEADICLPATQNERHWVCAREDGSRYDARPTLGNGNNVNAGPSIATLRLMLGYDRILGDNFSIGARVGFAFRGASEADASFLPVHLEARAGYWFRELPFQLAMVRPHVFVSGGLAQVDTRVDVEVLEDGQACGAANPGSINSPCTVATGQDPNRVEPRLQTLRAYKQSGLGFASAGVGLAIAPIPLMQIGVAFRAGVTFPVVTPLLMPELSVGFGL